MKCYAKIFLELFRLVLFFPFSCFVTCFGRVRLGIVVVVLIGIGFVLEIDYIYTHATVTISSRNPTAWKQSSQIDVPKIHQSDHREQVEVALVLLLCYKPLTQYQQGSMHLPRPESKTTVSVQSIR